MIDPKEKEVTAKLNNLKEQSNDISNIHSKMKMF